MDKQSISKLFLWVLIIAIGYAVYRIFQPFLVIIIAAMILASIFYKPYEKLVEFFKGRRGLASFVMCLFVAILVILPLANLLVFTAQKSLEAYDSTLQFINERDLPEAIRDHAWNRYNFLGLDSASVKNAMVDMAKNVNNWLLNGAKNFLKGTTSFIFSFLMILLTMFFFFVDGKKMLEKIMFWTPLSNKYDREIFKKFQEVSSSTLISTFVTAIAQGLVGAIGFMIVGVPAFFAGIAMGFFSLFPYVGTALVWVPVSIYLLVIGKIWQGIFLIIWGAAVVGMIDNFLRAYIIKDKAQVHPIFILFSILGGIALFGFWGVFFGPLIISLAVTVMHIYELEYKNVLEK